jgi:serine/threonine protein kinase
MSFKNVDELAQFLVGSRLVEPSQVEECRSQLRPAAAPADLLRLLESKNYLTSYQMVRLEKGETDGLVLGPYKLMYKNASGSFARVFRACSLADGRMVGLKVLRQRWAADPQMVLQFKREAELCKTLRHRNIVPIYSVESQGDFHYFTMEFVEGGNLRDFINIRKKLSPAEATRCILDMAEGLDYALGKGITHRDLKLTNVLMSSTGVAKLVDFGLAGNEGISGSSSGDGVARALEYATLEKATNAPANDPRSDLYFLGGIFYELLTGTPPYPRTRSREERKQFSRYKDIRPIRSVDPNIPRVVADIVERLMNIVPSQRYQKPAQVITDLRAALAQLGGGPASSAETRSSAVNDSAAAQRSLPTIMCVETRMKQQDMLREYLSKHGFRVLVLADVQRAVARLKSTPPDCVIFMGESLGDDVIDAYQQSALVGKSADVICIAVLAKEQAPLTAQLEQSPSARVLVQPIALRDLRREIHLAFQRHKRDAHDEKLNRE